MHVIDSQLLESCIDKSVVRALHLSESLGERVMHRMARRGRLQYFPHFPRPYFRIDRSQVYVVQGVFGNREVRVTFSPQAGADAEAELIALIETPLGAEDEDVADSAAAR